MALLELTSNELRQKLEAELASNPALELVDDYRCPHCQRVLARRGPCPVCSSTALPKPDQPIVFVSPSQDFSSPRRISQSSQEFIPDELMAQVEELPTFVLRQIAPELDPSDRSLAAYLLNSLDKDGLLCISLAEAARYHHISLSHVEKVLRLIQRAEPIGVGSPTPKDALLIQLEILAESRPVPTLAAKAIQNGMDLLSRRAFSELGRMLKVSANQAAQIACFISENLNPFPARSYWGEHQQSIAPEQVYHHADILISRLLESAETPLVVEIISPYSGMLRVNPLFREALSQAPDEKNAEWQAALDNASLLVKCLQQRNHTLVRLMQRLVVLQRPFILDGDAFLQPVTRAQLANELQLHESTISRAVSNKAVQLPNRRIIPLDKFFDRSLHIRTALLEIIEQEEKPLSDAEIASLLEDQGFSVARRTVAKYRSIEGILPARLRDRLRS
jgi:RNA polymerase sigma-54 factor